MLLCNVYIYNRAGAKGFIYVYIYIYIYTLQALAADSDETLRRTLVVAASSWLLCVRVRDLLAAGTTHTYSYSLTPLEILLSAVHDSSPSVRAAARCRLASIKVQLLTQLLVQKHKY